MFVKILWSSMRKHMNKWFFTSKQLYIIDRVACSNELIDESEVSIEKYYYIWVGVSQCSTIII